MKLKAFRLVSVMLALCALAGTLSGCALFPVEPEELPPPLVEAVVASYTTYNPERGTVENIVYGDANVYSETSVDVAFGHSSGVLTEVHYRLGDSVQAGDVLAETENSALEEKLKVAEMQAEIDELVYADTVARYEKGEVDEITMKKAELAIYLSRRDINALRDEYNATQLIAPVSGKLTYVTSSVKGAQVEAGKVMFTISDMDNLFIRYVGADSKLVPVGVDAQLTYTRRDGSEGSFTGLVTQTPATVPEDSVDKNTVFVESDNIPDDVTVGSRLKFLYVVERSENTLYIKTSSIKTIGDRKYVYVVEDGYRQERDVTIGLQNSEYTEILSGLTEADAVIR